MDLTEFQSAGEPTGTRGSSASAEIKFEEPDTSTPLGKFLKVWIGHSADPGIRENAASGGMVSSILVHLLEEGAIDAALVCRTVFSDGKLDYEIFLAKSREEILSAQTSRYFDIPMLKGMKLVEAFEGRVAVVGLPSQINSISRRMAHNADLARKIVLKISIFCGHNSKDELVRKVWEKKGIQEDQIERFHYRKGLWRGKMRVEFKGGGRREFPFQEFSHYQNLHILSLDRCLSCFDHMGYYSDISTGDVWMRSERGSPVKPSIFLARSRRGLDVVESMIAKGKLKANETDRRTLYRSQKRSINYHYNISARARLSKWFGMNIRDRIDSKPVFRDYLAAFLVLLNHKISKNPRYLSLFMRLPKPVIAAYVYLFKGLTHYERKNI